MMSCSHVQNLKGKPDTYVQLYLLPGKHKEVKTKIVKNNPNPLFAETIKFQVPSESLPDRMLVLHVTDKDTFSKDDKLGEVQVPLNSVDLNRKSTFVRELGPVTNILSTANIGRIKYSLSYDPPTNKVILEIIRASVSRV